VNQTSIPRLASVLLLGASIYVSLTELSLGLLGLAAPLGLALGAAAIIVPGAAMFLARYRYRPDAADRTPLRAQSGTTRAAALFLLAPVVGLSLTTGRTLILAWIALALLMLSGFPSRDTWRAGARRAVAAACLGLGFGAYVASGSPGAPTGTDVRLLPWTLWAHAVLWLWLAAREVAVARTLRRREHGPAPA